MPFSESEILIPLKVSSKFGIWEIVLAEKIRSNFFFSFVEFLDNFIFKILGMFKHFFS